MQQNGINITMANKLIKLITFTVIRFRTSLIHLFTKPKTYYTVILNPIQSYKHDYLNVPQFSYTLKKINLAQMIDMFHGSGENVHLFLTLYRKRVTQLSSWAPWHRLGPFSRVFLIGYYTVIRYACIIYSPQYSHF